MRSRKKLLVYIVDDDPFSIEVLKDHLSQKFEGLLDMSTFSTGKACLEALKHTRPGIVFLDYNLNAKGESESNGLRILSEIRDTDDEIEVVMLSGQQKIDVAVEAMKRGARDYIIKGETAGLRAEKYVEKYLKSEKERRELKDYKTGFRLVIILQVVIMLMAIGIYFALEPSDRNSMIILGGLIVNVVIFIVYMRMKSLSFTS